MSLDVVADDEKAPSRDEGDILMYLYAPAPRRFRTEAVARSSPPWVRRSVSRRLHLPHGSRLYYCHLFIVRYTPPSTPSP